MTTEDAVIRFEREYQGYNNISAERRKAQVKTLREFADRIDGQILEAEPSDLSGYAADLVERGLHVNTVRKRLNMIRPFFSWALAADLIDGGRYMALKRVPDPRGATGRTLPNPYTRTEVKAFWAQLHEQCPKIPAKGNRSQALTRWLQGRGRWARVRPHALNLQIAAMVRLALDMGLRRAEIFGLTVNDCHYDLEYLTVVGKADPNTGLVKVREVPFTEAARAAIKAWLEFRALLRVEHDSPWLSCWFMDTYDNPMQWTRFKSLLSEVVGTGWRWHRFRHTCGTEWLRSGMPLEMVQELLGHANIQQTLGYAQILKSDVARHMARHEATFKEAVSDGP